MMLGRRRDLGLLRTAFDRSTSSVVRIAGPAGSGKTGLALAAVADRPHVYHRVPPLPEPLQRAALAATLVRGGPGWSGGIEDGRPPAGWEELLVAASGAAEGAAPAVLILDDAHRLAESRARFLPALRAALGEARERGRAIHIVLVSAEPVSLDERDDSEFGSACLRLGPLDFRSAVPLLPGSDATERLRAYSVFGGMPGSLTRLDRVPSLATNLRRLVLEPGAPLGELPMDLLERVTQTPSRYVAILRALSDGEADWSSVHAGVPDVTASGQLAPYLKRLEEMGWIEARRSLDAGPRSRSRRYRIADPFTVFWFRFVFPYRERFASGGGAEAVTEAVRAELETHVASILPAVCRQYMLHDAVESLGSNARECGSLWGPGYDIPVAGILGSGAAFYGAPVPPGENGRAILSALDRQIRETRYGFSRERRLRVLFTRGGVPPELAREAARRHDVVVVDAGALAGEI